MTTTNEDNGAIVEPEWREATSSAHGCQIRLSSRPSNEIMYQQAKQEHHYMLGNWDLGHPTQRWVTWTG